MTKEEAIEQIEWYFEMDDGTAADNVTKRAINMAINAMEALENERPKGYWILSQSQNKEDNDNGNYRFECSNCGCSDTHSKATEVPYCWKCGADMRGKDDE